MNSRILLVEDDPAILRGLGDNLFSDGLTAALGATGAEFGRDAAIDVVCRNRDVSAEAMRDALHAAVRAHALGHPQSDDLTLVASKAL